MQEIELVCIKKKWNYLIKNSKNYNKLDKEGLKILAKAGILMFTKPSAYSTRVSDDEKEIEFKFLLNKRLIYLKISDDGKALIDIILPPDAFNQSLKNEYILEHVREDWDELSKLYNEAKYKQLIKKVFKYMHELGIGVFHIGVIRITIPNDNEIMFEFYVDEILIRLSITRSGRVINETFWKKLEVPFP